MKQYILKRVLLAVPVVFGVLTLVFFLGHAIPGDPVDIMLGEFATVADREALRQSLHLDDSLLVQYGRFLGGLFTGDLGVSFHSKRPVMELILSKLPATFKLTAFAMVCALLIAFPLGIISALKKNTLIDYFSMIFAMTGVSMPNFWLGPLLIIAFSINLGWLPVSGMEGWQSYFLPAITLGMSMSSILTRLIRASLLEIINSEYLVCARAKGLSESVVILKHGVKNAMIPVITVIGLQLGSLLAGSIITETIFSWPGIGRLTVQAINTRDYPVLQGCVLVIAVTYVTINLLTDIAYAFLDPRITYQVK